MGGDLICRIVGRGSSPLGPRRRLSADSPADDEAGNAAALFCRAGFAIETERAAPAAGRYYTAMAVRYDGLCRPCGDCFAWTGKLPEDGATEATAYLRRLRRYCTKGRRDWPPAEKDAKPSASTGLCAAITTLLEGR
jgi:hypothetical protein